MLHQPPCRQVEKQAGAFVAYPAPGIGDEISGMSLNLSERHKNLRIVNKQHIFWVIEGSHMSHKICVWTELLGQ